MAKTKALALSTTPLTITVLTPNVTSVEVKEDESVTGWPTTNLIAKQPDSTGDPNTITAGKSYFFTAQRGATFEPGTTLGTIALPSGTTSGVQTEQ